MQIGKLLCENHAKPFVIQHVSCRAHVDIVFPTNIQHVHVFNLKIL